jgi:hypothetical protein
MSATHQVERFARRHQQRPQQRFARIGVERVAPRPAVIGRGDDADDALDRRVDCRSGVYFLYK